MSTREQLMQRPDIPDDHVDDIVEIAARLQDEAQAESERATPEQIKAIAAELDIASEHVTEAIEQWRRAQAEEAAAAEAEALAEAADQAVRNSWYRRGVAVMLVGLVALGGLAGVSTMGAAQEINLAHDQVVLQEGRLQTAIDRQVGLAPQLVALAGGDASSLQAAGAAVQGASDIDGQVTAAQNLGTAMATEIGSLPAATTEADAQARLNLQYEVTGSQNRLSTELRRYRDAHVAWEAAADGFGAGLAVTFGMADGP